MKNSISLLLILIAILFSACPYEGEVELNTYEESPKYDKELFGEWGGWHDEGYEDLDINKGENKGNNTVLHVHHTSYDEVGDKMETNYHRAYATEISGKTIYNIEKKNGKWWYCTFEKVSEEEFILSFISDEYMEGKLEGEEVTSAFMRNYIEEHLDEEGFLDESIHFYNKESDLFKKKKKEMEK